MFKVRYLAAGLSYPIHLDRRPPTANDFPYVIVKHVSSNQTQQTCENEHWKTTVDITSRVRGTDAALGAVVLAIGNAFSGAPSNYTLEGGTVHYVNRVGEPIVTQEDREIFAMTLQFEVSYERPRDDI